jgi:hypothetical protein
MNNNQEPKSKSKMLSEMGIKEDQQDYFTDKSKSKMLSEMGIKEDQQDYFTDKSKWHLFSQGSVDVMYDKYKHINTINNNPNDPKIHRLRESFIKWNREEPWY